MVKTNFVKSWNRSIQPRKQRKYAHNAPLHTKQKLMHIHLLAELRKKYNFRNIQVKKGDKVKVLRGKFRKKEAKVDRVDLKREKVYLAGVEIIKRDGTKLPIAFTPSNLLIIELDLSDKKRKQKLEQKVKKPAVEKNINKKADEKTVNEKITVGEKKNSEVIK